MPNCSGKRPSTQSNKHFQYATLYGVSCHNESLHCTVTLMFYCVHL